MHRVLLTGRTGQLGHELVAALAPLGEVIALGRAEMDLANTDSIRRAIREAKPDILVNAAGYTAVDRAESEPELAMELNAVAPGMMAREAKRIGALLVHYSTDYVFDGALGRPYTEEDAPNPVNAYGRSKLAGERAIEAVGGAHLILRASWIYSGRGANFVLTILRLARERLELPVVSDQLGSPSWARALALATADILRRPGIARGHPGIYHLAAAGHVSRCEFARAIIRGARETSGPPDGWARVTPVTTAEYPPLPARRPLHLVTSKDKIKRIFGIEMPPWEEELRAFLLEFLGGAQR